MKLYDKLCNPAKFYFILSTVTFILILLQNIGTPKRFALGSYSCRHSSPGVLLFAQAIYIVFWTWLLNLICKVNPSISWIIVLFPFLLFFIALGLVLFQGMHKDKQEGFGYGEASQMTI
jgi:hypothetical protein